MLPAVPTEDLTLTDNGHQFFLTLWIAAACAGCPLLSPHISPHRSRSDWREGSGSNARVRIWSGVAYSSQHLKRRQPCGRLPGHDSCRLHCLRRAPDCKQVNRSRPLSMLMIQALHICSVFLCCNGGRALSTLSACWIVLHQTEQRTVPGFHCRW